ncbi:MAG: hypothetical protein CFH06_01365 [Alphaproteobacteria bacterium MarineAlpha3_Bin5]|nr:hypothetical protein [Magnetovibrio sp.]PPR77257.1 MAG: hypothetical protein CFH06_01365 [Alphaproteobacteria bacterium MarineAlpha3_Bin5]|tara:strand:- start:521 stop:811 length:291 start_codon:yes stop_codon:yes gene_type:complete
MLEDMLANLVIFIVASTVTLTDPLSSAGFIISGLVFRRYFFAITFGLTWAAALDFGLKIADPIYQHQILFHRLLGSLIMVSIVFVIMKFIRKNKES